MENNKTITFRCLEGFADITKVVQSAPSAKGASETISSTYIAQRQNRVKTLEATREPVSIAGLKKMLQDARQQTKDFAETMGQIHDFALIILCEWIQKYWLEALKHWEALEVHHKERGRVNDISKAVESLMIYTKHVDSAYTISACNNFPSYAYDFVNEGFSIGVRMQYDTMQRAQDALHKFMYTWRNVVLAMKVKEVDAVAYTLMVRDMAASGITIIEQTYRSVRRRADDVGLRTKRRNVPAMHAIHKLATEITEAYATRGNTQYEKVTINGALNNIERFVMPTDMNLRIDAYALHLKMEYARYVVARLLLEYRLEGALGLKSIEALSRVLSEDELITLGKELRKMRIGLGETDPVELSKIISKAKNIPVTEKLIAHIIKERTR